MGRSRVRCCDTKNGKEHTAWEPPPTIPSLESIFGARRRGYQACGAGVALPAVAIIAAAGPVVDGAEGAGAQDGLGVSGDSILILLCQL